MKPEESIAIARVCLQKNPKKILTPLIFVTTSNYLPSTEPTTTTLLLFENLLMLVCKTYYKSSFQMDTLLSQLQVKPQENVSERGKILIKHRGIKKTNKRGRRGGWRGRPRGRGRGRGAASRMIEEEEAQVEAEVPEVDDTDKIHLLDYLISPLKIDLVFGFVNRNVVRQGNSNFRMLFVSFWEAIWHN